MNTQLVALESKITLNNMFEALLQQLNKDFYLANVNFNFNKNLTFIQVYQQLSSLILNLFKNEYDQYLNLIYRIDISEKKLKSIKTNEVEEVTKLIAYLILEREFQKLILRAKFQ